LFNTSFDSWGDAWLLNTGAISHVKFRKDLFEDFDENVDGIVYFSYRSSLKPSGMGTIRHRLHGFPNFLLHNVLYLPELQRNFLFLVHMKQKGHYVHIFGGKVEIRKDYENMVIMIGIEDLRLLNLKGTSSHTQLLHTSLITLQV
jgi:hypothetical protein